MSGVLSSGLVQERIKRAFGRRPPTVLRRSRLHLAARRATVRLLLSSFLSLLYIGEVEGCLLLTGFPDRLQQAGPDLCPTDQQQRTNSVERRLPVLPRHERLRHVQRQRNYAGKDQQPAGRTEHSWRSASEGQVPGAEQQTENREVNCGRDERRHPDWHSQLEGEAEDVAEAEQEREPNDGTHDH